MNRPHPSSTMPPIAALAPCALGYSGQKLPGELVNIIFKLALEDDNRAIVLPGATAAITIARPRLKRKGGRRVDFAITSVHPLMRTCKESRNIYYSLFRPKVFQTNIDHLKVCISDFNFDYFLDDLVVGVFQSSDRAQDRFLSWNFDIELTFTEKFLLEPTIKNLDRSISRLENDGRAKERPFSFEYRFQPLEAEQVERVGEMINDLVFKRRGVQGPELKQLVDDMGRQMESGEIYG